MATQSPDSQDESIVPLSVDYPGTLTLQRSPELDPQLTAWRAKVFEELFNEEPRRKLGRYIVHGSLGQGGMGVVLKGFDDELQRHVAIKLLRADLAEHHGPRLKREAQALAQLAHPNVVQVYEIGEADGQLFVAMELVAGRTLREWQSYEPPRSWKECVKVYIQAGRGLAAAHAKGVVHRDFKPGNAILDKTGRVRVLDFGLARLADRDKTEDDIQIKQGHSDTDSITVSEPALTKTGVVLGTPAYMPPEQMLGQEANARSDQFSFCVALYEAVYGHRPFEGRSMRALMGSVMAGRLQNPPRHSGVPLPLRRLLLRGLSPLPDHRWPSMDALLVELQKLTTPRMIRIRWMIGGLSLVALSSFGMVWALDKAKPEPCQGAQDHLAGIWDETTKAEVEQGLVATELPFAADTARRVATGLDAYTQSWVEQHTAVCQATRIRGEQSEAMLDVRMTCLDRRLSELSALVRVLGDPGEETVSRAVTAVSELRPTEPCASAQPGVENALPEDPGQRSRFLAIQSQLDEAKALSSAGRHAAARDQAAAAAREAARQGFRRLLAVARVTQGGAHNKLREAEQAQQLLREGIMVASEVNDDRTELLGWIELLWVAGVLLEEPQQAEDWRFAAETALQRAGAPKELESRLKLNVGGVMLKQNRFDDATRVSEDALRVALEVGGHGSIQHAQALNNLGIVAGKQANWVLAERRLRESYELKKQLFGPDHPAVISNGMNLANVLIQDGKEDEEAKERDFDEAERLYEKGLAFRERTYGTNHLSVARTLVMLGRLQANRKDWTRARTSYERALTILRGLKDAEGSLASALNNLARLEFAEGGYEPAEAHHREALEIQLAKYGESHLSVGQTRQYLCGVLLQAERFTSAVKECERALAVFETSYKGRSNPVLVKVHNSLAKAHESLGHTSKAANHRAEAEQRQKQIDTAIPSKR